MSYVLTYQMGAALTVGEAVAGNHRLRLSMAFTVNDTGSNTTKFCRDYGIGVYDWGEINLSRELDEKLIIPSEYTFSLFDASEELWALLFEGTLVPKVEKDARVTLDIQYGGVGSYVTVFIGSLDNNNISYNRTTKVVDFYAIPKTDILKSTYLYEEVSTTWGSFAGNNPLGLSYTVNSKGAYVVAPTLIKTIIHEIFKKVSATCTLEWQHDWYFRGAYGVTLYDYFKLEDLYAWDEFLSCMFFDNDNQMQLDTLYDILTMMGVNFGFLCGMITTEKAFVKELYKYNALNTQTLGTVKKVVTNNKYGNTDAARIKDRRYSRHAVNYVPDTNNYKEYASKVSIVPSNATVRGENCVDERILFWAAPHDGVLNNPMIGKYGGNNYQIEYVKPSGVGLYKVMTVALANFYYNLRNRKKYNPGNTSTNLIGRIDDFTVNGIEYDYLKDFEYLGNGYQILSLRKRLAKNTSEISAIVVVDTLDGNSGGTTDAPPDPLRNILPGGYFNNYTYNSLITDVEANLGTYSIINLYPNQRLAEIKILVPQSGNVTGFESVTAISIEDNDGVIWSGDATTGIKWKAETDETLDAEGIRNIKFYEKTYAAQQTLQIKFTGAAAVGALMNVEVKILARN